MDDILMLSVCLDWLQIFWDKLKDDDDDDGDDVRIGSMEEGGVGGKEVHILSLEWNGAGLM